MKIICRNVDLIRQALDPRPTPLTGDAYNPTGVGDDPTVRKARFEQ
jgi:hypothetical protein